MKANNGPIKIINLEYNLASDSDKYNIAHIGKALSSPARIHIIRLLYKNPMTISEVAHAMKMPVSSAAFHLRLLEQAEIISIFIMPSKKGKIQICQLLLTSISFYISEKRMDEQKNAAHMAIPVGHYVDAQLDFVSGFYTTDELILFDDGDYFKPQRVNAQLIWGKSGYIVYAFVNLKQGHILKEIQISLEICSETFNYQNDWKSDITFSLNDIELFTYTSPGDFGDRRGRLNPAWLPDRSTQYGELKQITINARGCFLNGTLKNKEVTISDFSGGCKKFFFRVENKSDAFYKGGFNIFGKSFGDFPQDILFDIEWEDETKH